MGPQTNNLLDAETISQAEALGLHARYIVEGYRRTDRHYVKQYEQETNYIAHLLLDASESMAYGSGSITKMQYAKQLAACVAYLVLNQRDAVAVSMFDTAIKTQVPRTGNIGSIHTILTTLAAVQPSARTNVATTLHRIASTVPRRGIVILISDLFDDEEKILQGVQHLRFAGHEVIVFHVLDPCEIDFPFQGLIEFDAFEESSRLLTRPVESRKSYLKEMNAFRTRVREGCEKNRSHYVLANTSQPLQEMLGGYLAFRARTH
jgi:uncharacterized protein (DUF58 family)